MVIDNGWSSFNYGAAGLVYFKKLDFQIEKEHLGHYKGTTIWVYHPSANNQEEVDEEDEQADEEEEQTVEEEEQADEEPE